MKLICWVKLKLTSYFPCRTPEKDAAAMLCWGWSSWETYAGPRLGPPEQQGEHRELLMSTELCRSQNQAGKDL